MQGNAKLEGLGGEGRRGETERKRELKVEDECTLPSFGILVRPFFTPMSNTSLTCYPMSFFLAAF